jgi:hypothetical protein
MSHSARDTVSAALISLTYSCFSRVPWILQDFLPLLLPTEVRVKAFAPGEYLMFQDDPGASCPTAADM